MFENIFRKANSIALTHLYMEIDVNNLCDENGKFTARMNTWAYSFGFTKRKY